MEYEFHQPVRHKGFDGIVIAKQIPLPGTDEEDDPTYLVSFAAPAKPIDKNDAGFEQRVRDFKAVFPKWEQSPSFNCLLKSSTFEARES